VVAGAVMAVLVILTPLGLLAQGTAFGEDAPDELKDKLGLSKIPEGLNKYNEFWRNTLFPDYGFASGQHPVVSYLVSAVVGIVIVGLVIFVIAKLIAAAANRGDATADARSCEEVQS
jgi:cobalt/nickel transport system permease protein